MISMVAELKNVFLLDTLLLRKELNKAFEPTTYWQACKEQHWIEAMNKEKKALYDNDTLEITELPSERKVIGIFNLDVKAKMIVTYQINQDMHISNNAKKARKR
nr:ribonuclease H-like domain-containing protein [Tanacetum cinerariifolium]